MTKSTVMSAAEASAVATQLPKNDALQLSYDVDTLLYPDALEAAVLAAYSTVSDGLKINLKRYAGTKRWALETGGITVGALKIDTSRDSQAQINTAWRDLQDNPAKRLDWKQSDGNFANIGQAEMNLIREGVAAHLSDVFADEKVAVDGIDAGTITNTAQVDAVFA